MRIGDSPMKRNVFNAVADPTRRDILISLLGEKRNVNALADQFAISRQAVSLHLKYLEECGVIAIEKQGRERICELQIEKIKELNDWLDPFKKLWEARFDQLDSLLIQLKPK